MNHLFKTVTHEFIILFNRTYAKAQNCATQPKFKGSSSAGLIKMIIMLSIILFSTLTL